MRQNLEAFYSRSKDTDGTTQDPHFDEIIPLSSRPGFRSTSDPADNLPTETQGKTIIWDENKDFGNFEVEVKDDAYLQSKLDQWVNKQRRPAEHKGKMKIYNLPPIWKDESEKGRRTAKKILIHDILPVYEIGYIHKQTLRRSIRNEIQT